MKGNPFFTQLRPGKISKRTGKEKIFKLIKFRTMSNAKDKDGNLVLVDYKTDSVTEENYIGKLVGRYKDQLMYYKEAARKGKGRRRIEQELLNKKISKSVIRDALDEFVSEENPEYQEMIEDVGSESERALAVGRKMLSQHLELGKTADKNFMAKVGRRLMSLGYDSSILYSVIGTLMKEGKTSDDDY